MKEAYPACARLITILLLSLSPAICRGDEPGIRQKLAPGTEAGTFHFVYRDEVRFTGENSFPVLVQLLLLNKEVTYKTIADGQPFTIEADLRPGTYTLLSQPISKETREKYCSACGPTVHIDADGTMTQPVGPWNIMHVMKMSILEPVVLGQVTAKRPVLRWQPVPGAKQYVLGWFEEMPAGRRVVKTVQPLTTEGAQYQFEEDVMPKRLYEWYVSAGDANGVELARGDGYFLTPGAGVNDLRERPSPATPPPGSGWLGVSLHDYGDVVAQAIGMKKGVLVRGVIPDSPAVQAGLHAQDVVLKLDDKPVVAMEEFINQVAATTPGRTIRLTIWRDSKEMVVLAVVGKRPAPATQPTTRAAHSEVGPSTQPTSPWPIQLPAQLFRDEMEPGPGWER